MTLNTKLAEMFDYIKNYLHTYCEKNQILNNLILKTKLTTPYHSI